MRGALFSTPQDWAGLDWAGRGSLTGYCLQAVCPVDLCAAPPAARRIDELDEGCVLAEEVHFCRIDVLATRHGADCLKYLGGILAGLFLVNVLQLYVHLGLGLHIR